MKEYLKLSLLLVSLLVSIIQAFHVDLYQTHQDSVISPCRISKQKRYPKSIPFIRVVDEITHGASPDVVLGSSGGGLPYYNLPPGTPTEVVIECSSSIGKIKWSYQGRGATSGVKIVPAVWTSGKGKKLKPVCYSAALVISNITDQLTGEYTCSTSDSENVDAGNSFVLFVPQAAPFYHEQGDQINISVTPWSGEKRSEAFVLPCISRRRSAAGISLYKANDENGEQIFERMELGDNLLWDPFKGFLISLTKSLFNGTRNNSVLFVCKFDENLKDFPEIQNSVLLRINLTLRTDEKIAPESQIVKAFSPYFSWTTKDLPSIQLESQNKEQTVEWQQYFTKNDFEESNSSAPIFHLGSFQILNGTKGSKGSVKLTNNNSKLIYEWNYQIFDKTNEDFVGLNYDVDEHSNHVFTCISATEEKPEIRFKILISDEPNYFQTQQLTLYGIDNVEEYIISDCPTNVNSLGCVILTTVVPQGEVSCVGDGVKKTVRYPLGFVEASRPFFIERGETLRIYQEDENPIVTLPCLPNAAESQYFVHLFKLNPNGSNELIWRPAGAETIVPNQEGVEFYPNWGFRIDTSYNQQDSSDMGEYLCSSSHDIEDRSDAVKVIVSRAQFSVSPKNDQIMGTVPYSLKWAWANSTQNLMISEEELRPFVKVKIETSSSEGNSRKWSKGEIILTREILNSTKDLTITLVNLNDGSVVHKWNFIQNIGNENLDKNQGLRLISSTQKNSEEEFHKIEIICNGPKPPISISDHNTLHWLRDKAQLSYYFCQNPETCELIKKCSDKNCNPDTRYEVIGSQIEEDENCKESEGCLKKILKSVPLNGYMKAVCKFNGITEHENISQVFFSGDVDWSTEDIDDQIYLYVNPVSGFTDQNPQREVRAMSSSNLEWEIGDTVQFTCAASPYTFSHGIKWAVETRDGDIHFQNDYIYDPQFKYSGTTQVLSTFTLVIDNFDLVRVWCFVPTFAEPLQWRNSSQPVFIKEIDEQCHETEPSIRLSSMYPPPSRINGTGLKDMRLDKLEYFVVPEGTLQFSVKVTMTEPVEWSFSGFGTGPTMTPLIQSDRHITNFYDQSTYCYTSRLLVNLRQQNGNDTGRYSASIKSRPDLKLSFYLFMPSKNSPYLLQNGVEINSTLDKEKNLILPCLVTNPNIRVDLLKANETLENIWEAVDHLTIPYKYDPTRGFIFDGKELDETLLVGRYKCIVGNNSQDYFVVNVLPSGESRKKVGLKYEIVGDLNIFTCTSKSQDSKPVLNFTGESYEMKESSDESCSILVTTESSGTVRCVGENVDETFSFPPNSEKTGIWFDHSTNEFKCSVYNATEPPKLVSVICRRPNECQIMQSLLKSDGDNSQSKSEPCENGSCSKLKIKDRFKSNWSPNWFATFLRCKTENVEIFAQHFRDKGETVLVTKNSSAIQKFQEIRLDVVSFRREDKLVQGKFRCFANRYFYSRGIQWGLEKLDGTISFQDHVPMDVEVQQFSATMSEIRLEFDESMYKSLFCFVPFLESQSWANASIQFPVNQLIYHF